MYEQQPFPERPGVSLLPQSLSLAGRTGVEGLVGQPCLVSQLIAAFPGAPLPSVPKAVLALCRFPRANAVVPYLLLTISRNPNPRCHQHTEEKQLVIEVHFPGAYISTASRSAGENCSLVGNSCL